ncbi:MAG: TonB-dependent receptor [Acidobacteria bacterium]|nr:TonB-dependent receptor [Acidobacteriota bacterium]
MRARWLLLVLAGVFSLSAAEVQITGKVVDENQVAVAGARVWIESHSAISDHAGAFTLELGQPGDYKISAQREGYFLLRDQPAHLVAGENIVTLVLNNQREVFDSVEVSYSPPAVNTEETAATHEIQATELLGIPYPSTHDLRNALPLLPGVVRDSTGGLHFQGGSAEQTYWTLDGFNITDPLTGQLDTRVSVDGVRAIDFTSGRYSAENGKGSAGAVDIRTAMGDDRWRPNATNFFPGIESHKGLVLADWTPRATFAGPIRRGRAWLADSADAQYHKTVIEELPAGEDRSSNWRTSNLLRAQVNLTPANILTVAWLVNYFNAPHSGLSVLDPVETTLDRRSHQNFFSLKEQAYLGAGALLEVGYAATRGTAREVPQGRADYVYTPDGRRGNFFLDASRRSGRDQWLANVFFPSFAARGSHQIKAGVDLDRLTYYQKANRHAYEFLRVDGTLSRRVDFAGNSEIRRHNFEAASYLQDRWKPWSRLLVEAGVRLDWDQIIRQPVLSPRVSFSLAVPGLDNTKLTGGFGLFHDAANLRVLSRHLDQYTVTSYYAPDGRTLSGGPTPTFYLVDDRLLRLPVYRNWSAGLEHLFPRSLHARFEYLRKRGRDGFTFVPVDSSYLLRNLRRDTYDSFEVTARQTFHRQSEWSASYTRSRALSNAVVDPNIDDPLLVNNNSGRLAWDTPNRFLGWGIITMSEKNSIAWLAEWRDGFLFNVTDDEGRLVGKINEHRFPFYFGLNLHWERKFVFWRYRWAWRAGFNNLTNRLNPTVVNSNAASSGFLNYSGGQHRAFVLRIRWLGTR